MWRYFAPYDRAKTACAAVCVLCAIAPAAARASTSSRLIYVRDETAASCPDEERFRQAVLRRVGYDPFFAWAKTTVVVEITGDGSTFVARLRLVDDAGLSSGARELRLGPTGCQGLIDATALAISIALDIDSSAAPNNATTSPAPPTPPEPAPPPLPSPAPMPAHKSEPERVPNPVPARALSHFRWIVGVDALAPIGATPDVMPGVDVWVGGRIGPGLLGLELRGDVPDSASFQRGGSASIVLLGAGLDACGYLGPVFACVLGTATWIHASGSGVALPKSGSAFGVALGPRVGFDLPLVGSHWILHAKTDLLASILRPGVSLNGAEWTVPPLGGVLGAGLAYTFP